MIDFIYLIIFDIMTLFAAISMLAIGSFKRDATIIFFSSFMFILSGLNVANNGFGNLDLVYSSWLGGLLIFFSIYLIFRTAIEMIKG